MAQNKPDLTKFGIVVDAEFIPWTKSRNFDPEKHTGVQDIRGGKGTYLKVSEGTLNWKVTLRVNGREIITSDYSAGIGHAPSWKDWNPKDMGCRLSQLHASFLEYELEYGRKAYYQAFGPMKAGDPILPDPCTVVYSLLMDGEAIDYDFQGWCNEYGYDTDSMKAKACYDLCLLVGIKLRQAFGGAQLQQLRDAFADY